MPILYFVHQRKEFMKAGEAGDFLKHIYATKKASARFPRLHFDVPLGYGEVNADTELDEALAEQERLRTLSTICEANFENFQREYEKLYRCPASTKYAKKYLMKTSKKGVLTAHRDTTTYFKRVDQPMVPFTVGGEPTNEEIIEQNVQEVNLNHLLNLYTVDDDDLMEVLGMAINEEINGLNIFE